MVQILVEFIATVVTWIVFLLVSVAFFLTGEVILWAVTFGKRAPRWDRCDREHPIHREMHDYLSVGLGAAFWVAIVAAGIRALA